MPSHQPSVLLIGSTGQTGRQIVKEFERVPEKEKGDILKYFSRLESMDSYILKQLTYQLAYSLSIYRNVPFIARFRCYDAVSCVPSPRNYRCFCGRFLAPF